MAAFSWNEIDDYGYKSSVHEVFSFNGCTTVECIDLTPDYVDLTTTDDMPPFSHPEPLFYDPGQDDNGREWKDVPPSDPMKIVDLTNDTDNDGNDDDEEWEDVDAADVTFTFWRNEMPAFPKFHCCPSDAVWLETNHHGENAVDFCITRSQFGVLTMLGCTCSRIVGPIGPEPNYSNRCKECTAFAKMSK